MNPVEQFLTECKERVRKYKDNATFRKISLGWVDEAFRQMYTYNFSWLGRPIIQNPADIVALQELIWKVKPDLVIETGIAHGGSLILSASMLRLLDACESTDGNVKPSRRKVIGVDIDIRAHNRAEIEQHPLSPMIQMIQGSSIEQSIVDKVKKAAEGHKKILVVLDSNHTHEHVAEELKLYTPFVSAQSYCVVFDTIVEFLPESTIGDRPWKKGNSPYSAVQDFLKTHSDFEIDSDIEAKVMLSFAPGGFLKRVK